MSGGEQGIWDIEGDINIPLSENWALRAFAFTREDDGFMRNPGITLASIRRGLQPARRRTRLGAIWRPIVLPAILAILFSMTASVRYNEYDGPVNNWAREMGTPANHGIPVNTRYQPQPSHERETFGARLELNLESRQRRLQEHYLLYRYRK